MLCTIRHENCSVDEDVYCDSSLYDNLRYDSPPYDNMCGVDVIAYPGRPAEHEACVWVREFATVDELVRFAQEVGCKLVIGHEIDYQLLDGTPIADVMLCDALQW